MINLHLYPSSFKYESRMLKEANTIVRHQLASRVIIMSAWESGQPRIERITDKILVHRIKTLFTGRSKVGKALFYFEFYFRAVRYGLRIKPRALNCHSLMMLPIAVVVKKFRSTKLIYDPHELETERLGLSGLAQHISKWVERKLVRHCDAIIVVSPSIKRWYESSYPGLPVSLVRNVPVLTTSTTSTLLRETLGIPEGQLIFLYQGLVNEGRSIDLYLDVFAKIQAHHLVIMGYGPLEDHVRQFADRHANIHFHPAVPPNKVLAYTQSADVGLSLIENCCLSYYYSLPNKFFEYIMAEVPPIVSNFPDMSGIVNQHGIGWSINVSADDLYSLINRLSMSEIIFQKKKISEVKNQLCWENEEPALISVFKSLQ